ncbi:hypothetical protein [Ktedonobacter robiniae]|uniref:hypothetical protein n=1 Tax=Ktedonobacter robiniae TaxID=2778365 RepID=UPI001F211696|nr:hypothetical protein [Ktedonobacter robiniae]
MGRGGGGIAGVEVFLDAVLKGLQRIGWLILLVGVGDDGEGVFGEVAKEEVVGEVVKGMLFFCFPRPTCEDIEKGEEMVGPGAKDPVRDGDLEWGDRVWIGTLEQLVGVKEGGERVGQQRLNVSGLETMEADTKGAQKRNILLRW